jgi:hypothetical protein
LKSYSNDEFLAKILDGDKSYEDKMRTLEVKIEQMENVLKETK